MPVSSALDFMSVRMSMSKKISVLVSLLSWTPTACFAAAPVYFNLGGLISFVLTYVIGLIGLIVSILFAKQETRRTLTKILLAYLILPAGWLVFSKVQFDISQEENRRKAEKSALIREEGLEKNKRAFAEYCKNTGKTIHRNVPIPHELIISTRQESPTLTFGFSAEQIARIIHNKTLLCNNSELVFVEKKITITRESKQIDQVRRYNACADQINYELIPSETAKYALVLGKSGASDFLPATIIGGRMEHMSVHIQDLTSGEMLAEDTLYFIWPEPGYENGNYRCPNPEKQVSDLLDNVFLKR